MLCIRVCFLKRYVKSKLQLKKSRLENTEDSNYLVNI